ncbi:MAG: MarR family transcriptional regulator [Myxococcales bacterium]
MTSPKPPSAEPEGLDLGYLSLFVGLRFNELVLEALLAAGFTGIRHAHGYVFQHLLTGPLAVSELARHLGVTQQAASKSVAELTSLGYLEDTGSADARVRRVALTEQARAAIEKTRSIRAGYQRRLSKKHGAEVARACRLLASVLEDLGGAEAVRTRKVRAPR